MVNKLETLNYLFQFARQKNEFHKSGRPKAKKWKFRTLGLTNDAISLT